MKTGFQILFLLVFFCRAPVEASPDYINLQSRISKPSGGGYLEANSVQFRMTITDPLGTCILFQEDFANVDMTGSKGLINFKIGSGSKTYPVGPMAMSALFTNFNSPLYNCQAGGTYTAAAADSRKLVMQFNDGSGWQTVPSMEINSVPFSLESLAAQKLGTYPAADYVRSAQFATCGGSEAVHFNGTNFTCVALSSGASYSAITGATGLNSIDNTNYAQTWNWSTATTQNPMTMSANALTTGSLLNLTTSNNSLNSTNGILNVANTGTSTSGMVARIQSNSTAGSGLTVLANGNVGIGTTTPSSKLEIGPAGSGVSINIGTGGIVGPLVFKSSSGTSTRFITSAGGGAAYSDIRLNGNESGWQDNSAFPEWASRLDAQNDAYSVMRGPSGAGPISYSTLFTIKGNGNVGIGTTTPNDPLSIYGNANAAKIISITNPNIGASARSGLSAVAGSTEGTLDVWGPGIPASGFILPNAVGLSSSGSGGLSLSAYDAAGVLRFYTGGSNERMRVTSAGNVGIGTATPRSALDIGSGSVTGKAAVLNATSTVDMSIGNTQYTAANCGAFQFNNLKDGGSYMFVVKGAISTTCSFTAYSDAGVTGLTVHLPPDHGATTASKHTIYNLTVVGSDVYLAWTPGY